MIRRQQGSDWLLIAQDDHARLAGTLALRIGNTLFDVPQDRQRFADAVAQHDAGWIETDKRGLRNPPGEPIHFDEISLTDGLSTWAASSELASGDPLHALLVSLHGLSLSISRTSSRPNELTDASTRFALNKFQHRQIELLENCRRSLGLPEDVPLHHGLATDSTDLREQSIAHQFKLLQAMDSLSLAGCCTKPPAPQIRPLIARPGGREITVRLRSVDDGRIQVSPWPFDADLVTVAIPARRVTATPFESDEALRSAISAAPVESISITYCASR